MIVQTKRLTIRRFQLSDATFLLRLLNTPNWLKYIGDRHVHTISQAEEYLKKGALKSYETYGFGFYLVAEKETNRAIGTCGLAKRDGLDDIDIGFAFLPEFEGRGYGLESTSAVMDYAKNDLDIKRLIAITTPDNTPSINLILKLNMRFEKQILFGDQDEALNQYCIEFN